MTATFRRAVATVALALASTTSAVSAQTTTTFSNKAVPSNLTSTIGELGKVSDVDGILGDIAQTFTAPANFPLLQSFNFFLTSGYGDISDLLRLQINVFAFSANTRNIVGPSLFAATANGSTDATGDANSPATLRSFTAVDLMLAPGTTYAFLFRPTTTSPDGATNFVFTTVTDTYTGGQLFYSVGSTTTALGATGAFTASNSNTYGADAKFEATFGRATVVPEPSSIALVAAGLAGMFVVTRRRRMRV